MPLLYDQKNLKPISQQELDEVVKKHAMFVGARVGGARAMLSYRNLSNLIMRGAKLQGADFTGSLLFDCDLRGANLDGSVFFSANMQKAHLSHASMIRCDLRGCNLKGADFIGADLTAADMREGSIATKDRRGNINLMLQPGASKQDEGLKPSLGYFTEGVNASEAVFTGAKLNRAVLRGAIFENAILADADLSMAQMQGADLKGAVLRGAKLDGVDLTDVNIQGALRDELQGLSLEDDHVPIEMLVQDHNRWLTTKGAEGSRLDLSRYDLRGEGQGLSDFSGKHLSMMRAVRGIFYHGRFSGAQLQASELRENDFRLARFPNADLRGVDFSGSNLMRANLQAALIGPLKLPEGRVIKADFKNCNLRYADLTGADLRQANFAGADLTAADLRGADTEGALLEGAITEGALFGI